jgi:hypothetical protein
MLQLGNSKSAANINILSKPPHDDYEALEINKEER